LDYWVVEGVYHFNPPISSMSWVKKAEAPQLDKTAATKGVPEN